MPKKTKKQEEILSKLQPTVEDIIARKIKNLTSAKVIFWLCAKSKSEEYVLTSELTKFLRLSSSRAYQILREFSDLGILQRKGANSPYTEFHFTRNNTKPKVLKYLDKVKKRLEVYLMEDG